jgi:hypothetical protein
MSAATPSGESSFDSSPTYWFDLAIDGILCRWEILLCIKVEDQFYIITYFNLNQQIITFEVNQFIL